MAGAHLAFTLLVFAGLQDIQANFSPHNGGKPIIDPKRRSEIVDETFLEQKDILLEMLETKLKEVREKRKNKTLNSDVNGTNTNNNILDLHDNLIGKNIGNVDVRLNSKGISNIGENVVELKYRTGKGTVNMDAHGISNIGNMHVQLGVGDIGLFMPGFNELFPDGGLINNTKNVPAEAQTTINKVEGFRRAGHDETTTTKAATHNLTHNVPHKHHSSVKNSTVQVWNTPGTAGSTKIDVLPLVAVNSIVTATANNTATSNNTAASSSTAASNSTAAANSTSAANSTAAFNSTAAASSTAAANSTGTANGPAVVNNTV